MNDNRETAGTISDGTLTVRLVVRPVSWYPDGSEGCGVNILAFSEEGGAPMVPGPLLRIRAGTRVAVTIRNPLEEALLVWGLDDRGSADTSATRIEPGRQARITFQASVPGNFFYTARLASSRRDATLHDGQLTGALIVEPAEGSLPDRVLVLTRWNLPGHQVLMQVPESDAAARRHEVNVINGRSWPHTELLRYTTGDTVRLRVINASNDLHVMHLHGFHFRLTSHGDNIRDSVLFGSNAPLLVSEPLLPGRTISMEWVPTRPGNWIFHCHLQRHMSPAQRLERIPGSTHAGHEGRAHAEHDMAGLIIGISVAPAPGFAEPPERPRHRMRLFANVRPNVFGSEPGYGFVLQEGDREPAADSVRVPGSTLLLRQGEPTEIVVHNRLGKPLSVHWHGLELESYFDGVAGWSGAPGRIAPPIAPGDSFVVRITPPRAGTFIYHVHHGGPRDLASGLYGAFIVLDADAPRVLPETDRVFIVSRVPGNDTATVVNGSRMPAPIRVRAGESYRFRFIGIMPQEADLITLHAPGGIARWEHMARDGVEGGALPALPLPPNMTGVAAGMTNDYRFTASTTGDIALEFRAVDSNGDPVPASVRIPIRVDGPVGSDARSARDASGGR